MLCQGFPAGYGLDLDPSRWRPAVYRMASRLAPTPTANTPGPAGIVGRSGTSAPATQANCRPDSKRANAQPRAPSGASRWTIESNATLPAPDAIPKAKTSAPALTGLNHRPTTSPATPATSNDVMMMPSSFRARRRRGARIAPNSPPTAAEPTKSPNPSDEKFSLRKANARWNTRKPTRNLRPAAATRFLVGFLV